eukprot:458237-Pelagomonas_calceolata.AAC.4
MSSPDESTSDAQVLPGWDRQCLTMAQPDPRRNSLRTLSQCSPPEKPLAYNHGSGWEGVSLIE